MSKNLVYGTYPQREFTEPEERLLGLACWKCLRRELIAGVLYSPLIQDGVARAPHSCPIKEKVHHDYTTTCRCCLACEHVCAKYGK